MTVSSSRTGAPSTVAVIGAGLMGHGIAQAFAGGGWHVRLWDPNPEVLAAAVQRVGAALDGGAWLRAATSLAEAVVGVDLIVEAVPENLQLKRQLLRDLDALNPDAILATNTSVMRITDIAAESERAERVVGTHWWNPPHVINIVEVAGGERTAPEIRDAMVGYLADIGKEVIVVEKDVSGFIGNRMQFALWREALSLLQSGVADAATIDRVVRGTFGRRLAAMGPIENADYIGLDLTQSIMEYLLPSLNSDSEPVVMLREMVAAGDLGAKTGQGLLSWVEGDRERAQGRLDAHLRGSEPGGA